MEKKRLIELIKAYVPYDGQNAAHKLRVLDYLDQAVNFLGKADEKGHITASAWILSPEGERVLLTHHVKLDRWLQLGGHTELHESIWESALREAREESGIQALDFVQHDIFDIDVHEIPQNGEIPPHFHYDLRFLMRAAEAQSISVSEESYDVQWVPLEAVSNFTDEWSVLRMVEKTVRMKKKGE